MSRPIKIKRDGKIVILKIEKHEGKYALAWGDDNRHYLRKGRGMWKPAHITVR